MLVFDKQEIKEKLTLEDVYSLVNDLGGDPEYTSFGILSSTICHNPPGIGSRKLYYYSNSGLFHCYSGCADPSFDVFQLVIKAFEIQNNKTLDLNDAVRLIAARLGYDGVEVSSEEDSTLAADWNVLANYDRIQTIEVEQKRNLQLKTYDDSILSRFNYDLRLTPWLKEGISQEAIRHANIGYYPGGDQITIPHYDKDGRFIGLRGRTMCQLEGELYGKYRPIKVGNQQYNHPLGLNLYNLDKSKDIIQQTGKALVVESEKSCLLFQSYFGFENDITVACCGSSLSNYQMQLLLDAGTKEVILGFDRQFREINDEEYKKLKAKLIKLNNKYKNYVMVSIIFDKNMITNYKASPLDEGAEKFMKLFKERIIL